MSVTIHDVAKRAGVSHTTVSWTIHDHPGITEATKKKVFKAIEELDYHPNYLARSLVKGKTNTIAVIANFFSSPFEMEVLKGVEQGANNQKNPYMLTFYTTMGKHEEVLKDILYGKRADAAILLSISPPKSISTLFKKNKIPLIVIDEEVTKATAIQVDHFKGSYLATEHLIHTGKKHLALVIGDKESEILSQRERARGFYKALADNKLPFEKDAIFFVRDFYFEEGFSVFNSIHSAPFPIDGIFCAAGDVIAQGIMLEAKKNGCKIPEEYAIVGYDDIPSSSLVYPALTTIRQPLFQIGKLAYEKAALMLVDKKIKEEVIVYSVDLVVREST
jgi:LacI family transcriptional regulator